LYPSVVVSEIFLSKSFVRKFKGFRPSIIRLVCVLAYMGSFITCALGMYVECRKNFLQGVLSFCLRFEDSFLFCTLFFALFLRFLGALLCWLA
jgi:hypothetical protein